LSQYPSAIEPGINQLHIEGNRQNVSKHLLHSSAFGDSAGQVSNESTQIPFAQPAFKDAEKTYRTDGLAPEKRGHLSIKDFITSLEQRVNRETEISPHLSSNNTPLDQLMEKIVIRDEANKPNRVIQSFSKTSIKDPLVDRTELKNRPSEPASFRSSIAEIPVDGYRETTSLEHMKKGLVIENPEQVDRLLKNADPTPYRYSPDLHVMETPRDLSRSSFSSWISNTNQTAGERLFPAYLIDQVGRQISRSLLRGQNDIHLQLRPPEMGAIKVQMSIHEQTLKLGIIAENNSVKELLLSNVPQLREALMDQGIKLDRLDVEINGGFNPSLAEFKDQFHEGLKRGQNGFQDQYNDVVINDTPVDDAGDDLISNPWFPIVNNQRLDILA